jgi:hypothetical protein
MQGIPRTAGPPPPGAEARIHPLARVSLWLGVAGLSGTALADFAIRSPDLPSEFETPAILLLLASWLVTPLAVGLAVIARWRIRKRRPTTPQESDRLAWACVTGFVGFLLPLVVFPQRPHPGANEAWAASTLRTLNTALATYASQFNQGFPDSLHKLGQEREGQPPDASHADLVDPVMAGRTQGGTPTSFVKSAYTVTYRPGPRDKDGKITTYTITARPIKQRAGSWRSFFTDKSAVIHATAEDRDPTAQDPEI